MSTTFDWTDVAQVLASEAWRSCYTVEPPLSAADLAELEAALGSPLPAAYRSFVTGVASAVGGLHLLAPADATAHLVDPQAAFPVFADGVPAGFEPRRLQIDPAQARAAIDALGALLAAAGHDDSVTGLWQLADGEAVDAVAVDGGDFHQGALVALDLGCGEHIVVVTDGPLRDSVWRAAEAGWWPEIHQVDGAWVAHDFASFFGGYVHVV